MTSILDISPLVIWVIALSQLLTFGLTVWGLVSSGSRANAQTLEQHGTLLHDLTTRVTAIEHTTREGPTTKDLHALSERMTNLGGAISVLTERLKPIEAINERMQDILLEQGRRGSRD